MLYLHRSYNLLIASPFSFVFQSPNNRLPFFNFSKKTNHSLFSLRLLHSPPPPPPPPPLPSPPSIAMVENNAEEVLLGDFEQEGGYQIYPSTCSPNVPLCINLSNFPDSLAKELIDAPCIRCGNVGENWICLQCRLPFCSRYKNGCAVHHAQENESEGRCRVVSLLSC